MTNRSILISLVVLVIVIAGAFYIGRQSGAGVFNQASQQSATTTTEGAGVTPTAPNTSANPAQQPGALGTGKILFTITDEAAALDSLQSLAMTVTAVSLYSPQKGWVVVSAGPLQFDLLDLYRNYRAQLFATVGLSPGTYTALRINIGKLLVAQKNGLPSAPARLPSQQLQFTIALTVVKGQTSSVSLDINSSKSLYQATDGSFLFFPVVRVMTEHAIGTVQTIGNDTQLLNGSNDFDQTWGMDANGTLRIGFLYPSYLGVRQFTFINNVIEVLPIGVSTPVQFSAASAVSAALQEGYLTTVLSVQLGMQQNTVVWDVSGIKAGILTHVYLDTTTGALVAVK